MAYDVQVELVDLLCYNHLLVNSGIRTNSLLKSTRKSCGIHVCYSISAEQVGVGEQVSVDKQVSVSEQVSVGDSARLRVSAPFRPCRKASVVPNFPLLQC